MIIVGLGNIGSEYENTHHNVGFMCLDIVAKANNLSFNYEKKHHAMVAEYIFHGKKHLLVKPTTYMNNSGLAVRSILDYYQKDLNDLFVIYDDLALPLASIRIRKSGSAGGHNGIKSIIANTGSENFARMRIGIKKEQDIDTISYVLSPFSSKEKQILEQTLEKMPNIIDDLLTKGIDYIMNNYNGV